MDLGGLRTILAKVGERWGLRGVDDHGHSELAMLDLRAIEIHGICVVHSDLESCFLHQN